MKIWLLTDSGMIQGVEFSEEKAREWLKKQNEWENHFTYTHCYPGIREYDTDGNGKNWYRKVRAIFCELLKHEDVDDEVFETLYIMEQIVNVKLAEVEE